MKELLKMIDKKATYCISYSFKIEVYIKDARKVFGRADVLIEPVSGTGEMWVQKNSVRLL